LGIEFIFLGFFALLRLAATNLHNDLHHSTNAFEMGRWSPIQPTTRLKNANKSRNSLPADTPLVNIRATPSLESLPIDVRFVALGFGGELVSWSFLGIVFMFSGFCGASTGSNHFIRPGEPFCDGFNLESQTAQSASGHAEAAVKLCKLPLTVTRHANICARRYQLPGPAGTNRAF